MSKIIVFIKNKKDTRSLMSILLDHSVKFDMGTINGSQWVQFTFDEEVYSRVSKFIERFDWTSSFGKGE